LPTVVLREACWLNHNDSIELYATPFVRVDHCDAPAIAFPDL